MTAPARTLIIVHPQRSERVPGIGLDGPRPARVCPTCPGGPTPGPLRGPGPGRPVQLCRPPAVPRGSAVPDRVEPAHRRAMQVVIAGVVTLTVVSGLAVLGQVAAGGPAVSSTAVSSTAVSSTAVSSTAVSSTAVPATTTVVQVGAGETVWDVARRVAPDAATPAVVQRIRELNGMVGSELRPGQQLTVPDGR